MGTYGNPYTAVPEALRETRRTLRDILTDMADTRSEEFKLQLGLSKQKGELELAAAKRKIEQKESAADRALEEKKLRAIEGLYKAKGDYYRSRAGGKTDTLLNRINNSPVIDPKLKDVFLNSMSKDQLNQELTDEQANELLGVANADKSFVYRNARGLMLKELNDLAVRVKDPLSAQLSWDDFTALNEEYEEKFEKVKLFDLVMGNSLEITPEEDKKIQQWAVKEAQKDEEARSAGEIYKELRSDIVQVRKEAHPGGNVAKNLFGAFNQKLNYFKKPGMQGGFHWKDYSGGSDKGFRLKPSHAPPQLRNIMAPSLYKDIDF